MNTNINENPIEVTTSQVRRITDYMLGGHAITSLEALRMFGCARLASRIHDIREKGYNVERKMISVGKKRVAEYRIV